LKLEQGKQPSPLDFASHLAGEMSSAYEQQYDVLVASQLFCSVDEPQIFMRAPQIARISYDELSL
jgi:hypothetical protein